jgi:hypothetical protein
VQKRIGLVLGLVGLATAIALVWLADVLREVWR